MDDFDRPSVAVLVASAAVVLVVGKADRVCGTCDEGDSFVVTGLDWANAANSSTIWKYNMK